MQFDFYGTAVRAPRCPDIQLGQVNGQSLAHAWRTMEDGSFNGILNAFKELRNDMDLCDWAFMTLVRDYASARFTANPDRAAMLAGFILKNSGLKIQYAMAGGHLDVFFGCNEVLYNRGYTILDGQKYYSLYQSDLGSYSTYPASGNSGRLFNVEVKLPKLESTSCHQRELSSHDGQFRDTVSVCDGLMPFFAEYPKAAYISSFVSRWAICARTPLSETVQETLYPQLRRAVEGKSPYEAVDLILSICQKSFPYGYDDEIWGGDRAFYPEESLFYPKSDCEDHAIFFARLIHDILGYDVALVYIPSPAHLFAAVAAPGMNGDYIAIDGKKFYVCEPTVSGGHIVAGKAPHSISNASALSVFE